MGLYQCTYIVESDLWVKAPSSHNNYFHFSDLHILHDILIKPIYIYFFFCHRRLKKVTINFNPSVAFHGSEWLLLTWRLYTNEPLDKYSPVSPVYITRVPPNYSFCLPPITTITRNNGDKGRDPPSGQHTTFKETRTGTKIDGFARSIVGTRRRLRWTCTRSTWWCWKGRHCQRQQG